LLQASHARQLFLGNHQRGGSLHRRPVESAPNRGSRVRCVIPLLPADTVHLADTRDLPLPID